MRTTIEITDEQRARLLELAARRGEKGFSRIVQEALDRYLSAESLRAERVEAALSVIGSWSDAEAERLRDSVRQLRERWR
jgi:predicted transcriptional regulator